jgi:hypothetical protein
MAKSKTSKRYTPSIGGRWSSCIERTAHSGARARERTRALAVNSKRIKFLARWDFSSYPKKLPIPIARWVGTAWHRLGSPATGHTARRLALAAAKFISQAQADGSGTTHRYAFVPLRVVRIQFSARVG